MGHKHLTRLQINEMNDRVKNGESKLAIAQTMNLAHDTVVRHTPRVLLRTAITENIKQEMIDLVEAGKSKAEVAEIFGVSRGTVCKYTFHVHRRPNKITPKVIEAISHKIKAGVPSSNIARDLRISRNSVLTVARHVLKDYELSEQQTAAIWIQRESGIASTQIALNLGIPLSSVYEVLGIETTRRYPEEVRKGVITAIELGEPIPAVARRFEIPRTVAWDWFNKAVKLGQALRPKKPLVKGDDFQFTWISRKYPDLKEWQTLIVGWFEAERPSTGLAIQAVTAFVERYLIAANLPTKPVDLLLRGHLLPDFYDTACPKSDSGRQCNAKIYELIEWVLDSPGFADISGYEPIRITDLYRNPINLKACNGLSVRSPSESTKIVLPYFLIADLRKRIVQGENFRDWTWTQGLLGYETVSGQSKAGDWFPVEKSQLDLNDLDCVWRLRKRVNQKPILEMWSPVRWVHTLLHLQTTTRSGQARMVDSGEADTYMWKDGKFILNHHILRQGSPRKPRQQGIFHRPSPQDSAQGAQISLYFNSNKTGDRHKSSSAKGFECPWPQMQKIEEDPYYWLSKLRDWQMKYNSINRLTPWHELKGQAKLSVKSSEQALEYPDTAFLFRAPENLDNPSWPITSDACDKAWQKLLTSYESVLAEEDIKHPSGEPISLINPDNGRAWSSPHATRTSLITHLIIDGDVPPILMMKIAGHARFIMTIYYTKVGITNIQNAIKEGTERIEAFKYQSFERDLLSAKEDQIRNRIVFNAEDWKSVLSVNPADRNPLGWMHLHDGICLAGGNTGGSPSNPGCHNGGIIAIAATKQKAATYGPVPGGGRNCSRCRWKAAGKQHLLGLAATYNNRAYHMHNAKSEAIAAERERNRLMQDKARIESTSEPYTKIRNLIDAERRHDAAMHNFQELALDVAALHRSIERIMALPDCNDGPTALAAQGDQLTVNMVIEHTESELLQLATVCGEVELFPDLNPGTAIFEFAQLLDNAFEREDQPMTLAHLSEKEKLAAANAIMRELGRTANPKNSILGRRMAAEIMDRGSSLERMLGIKLERIRELVTRSCRKQVIPRLASASENVHDSDHSS